MIGTTLPNLIFQNSSWIIHIAQIILRIPSQFFTTQCENYSMIHLRVNLLIQTFSFQQHVLILICVITVIDDFTFKEWNWFSYFSNRCLILLRLWSQLLINKFFIKYLWSSKKTLTIFAVIKSVDSIKAYQLIG